jgi:hypothetical protein
MGDIGMVSEVPRRTTPPGIGSSTWSLSNGDTEGEDRRRELTRGGRARRLGRASVPGWDIARGDRGSGQLVSVDEQLSYTRAESAAAPSHPCSGMLARARRRSANPGCCTRRHSYAQGSWITRPGSWFPADVSLMTEFPIGEVNALELVVEVAAVEAGAVELVERVEDRGCDLAAVVAML